MGTIRVGLSGWSYPEWAGDFYPKGLAASRRLGFVAERFDTVEINRTFYSLAKPETFREWRDAVPPGFVFAVKGSRFITHNKKLVGVETALANFFASGVLELGAKLGPILWQLPESLRFRAERVDEFLTLLPGRTDRARSLARGHDHRVGRAGYGPDQVRRLRHVLEVRHPSFLCDDMARIARRHGVALAFSHSGEWPYVEEVTAGFVYLRLHGPDQLYASGYDREALRRWARRCRSWQRGEQPEDSLRVTGRRPPLRRQRDVYVYFDNDAGGYAPRDAAGLVEATSDQGNGGWDTLPG